MWTLYSNHIAEFSSAHLCRLNVRPPKASKSHRQVFSCSAGCTNPSEQTDSVDQRNFTGGRLGSVVFGVLHEDSEMCLSKGKTVSETKTYAEQKWIAIRVTFWFDLCSYSCWVCHFPLPGRQNNSQLTEPSSSNSLFLFLLVKEHIRTEELCIRAIYMSPF